MKLQENHKDKCAAIYEKQVGFRRLYPSIYLVDNDSSVSTVSTKSNLPYLKASLGQCDAIIRVRACSHAGLSGCSASWQPSVPRYRTLVLCNINISTVSVA